MATPAVRVWVLPSHHNDPADRQVSKSNALSGHSRRLSRQVSAGTAGVDSWSLSIVSGSVLDAAQRRPAWWQRRHNGKGCGDDVRGDTERDGRRTAIGRPGRGGRAGGSRCGAAGSGPARRRPAVPQPGGGREPPLLAGHRHSRTRRRRPDGRPDRHRGAHTRRDRAAGPARRRRHDHVHRGNHRGTENGALDPAQHRRLDPVHRRRIRAGAAGCDGGGDAALPRARSAGRAAGHPGIRGSGVVARARKVLGAHLLGRHRRRRRHLVHGRPDHPSDPAGACPHRSAARHPRAAVHPQLQRAADRRPRRRCRTPSVRPWCAPSG